MNVRAERDMSAPPEVVFNTATDPTRMSAWLPAELSRERPHIDVDRLRARYDGSCQPCSGTLRVRSTPVGGALVEFELVADSRQPSLTETAERSLARLAREVADNLTAG